MGRVSTATPAYGFIERPSVLEKAPSVVSRSHAKENVPPTEREEVHSPVKASQKEDASPFEEAPSQLETDIKSILDKALTS